MISDNPVHGQNGLVARQDDSAPSGSGSWLGRAIQVLKGVTCVVSGVAAVVALASSAYALATVLGLISVVTGLSLLFGSSNNAGESSGQSSQSSPDDYDDDDVDLDDMDYTEFVKPVSPRTVSYHVSEPADPRPAPVTKMSSSTVSASPDNDMRLPVHKLLGCQMSLENGHRAVFGALQQMFMHCSMPRCSSILERNLDTLRTKEPFDEYIFVETAELLHADQSVIDGHQGLDKSTKIQLLEDLYKQQTKVPKVQLQHAKTQLDNLATIKQDFESYAPIARMNLLPDPVPEHEITLMKKHVAALETLLSNTNKFLDLLIEADDSLQAKMSEADAAVQKCKNILDKNL